MHRNKLLVFGAFLLLMGTSCINPFVPEIEQSDETKLVIHGGITAGKEEQTVNISLSSPVTAPKFIAYTGCEVTLLDDEGNQFEMADMGDGNYRTTLDDAFLVPGRAFKLDLTTPDGDHIVSDFDTLTSAAKLDSVYFRREDIEGHLPDQVKLGIQFYADISGTPEDSKYYRLLATETFEYHTRFPRIWWYNGALHHEIPPDSSRMFCWKTTRIPEIFTINAEQLSEINFREFELHYVDNQSWRLAVGYSLLVEEHSLSKAAFRYWDQQKQNSVQEGGLYEKQPVSVTGNLHNLTHPEKEVLGYFGASTVHEKRIFVAPIPDLPLFYTDYCDWYLLRKGLPEIKPPMYPAYLLGTETSYSPNLLNPECVNCLLLGGINVKPSFWPN